MELCKLNTESKHKVNMFPLQDATMSWASLVHWKTQEKEHIKSCTSCIIFKLYTYTLEITAQVC